MLSRVVPHGLMGLTGMALLVLSGCSRLGIGQDEMSWARAALERNERIEVVGVDQQTNSFMIRLKDSGEIRMVRLDQVIAGPPDGPGQNARSAARQGGESYAVTPGGAPVQVTAAAGVPAASAAGAPGVAGQDLAGQGVAARAGAQGVPAQAGMAMPGEAAAAPSAAAGAPGVGAAGSIPSGGQVLVPGATAGAGNAATDLPVGTDLPGGRVLAAGPGYTIKAASRNSAGRPRGDVEANVTTAALERRHEPIICQGSRLMQIDNRNLEFDGDAVAAEDGCEIHITNSRISAHGTGVLARAANVHIENSQIEGDQASIEVAQGGQIYARSSKFRGLSRRLDTASVEDLGGNVWN